MRRRDFLLGTAAAVASTALPAMSAAPAVVINYDIYGVGPMMAALPEFRAEMARHWKETARYVLGQTVIAPGAVLTCMATDG